MEESTACSVAWRHKSNTSAAKSCLSTIDLCRPSPLREESPEEAREGIDDYSPYMYDVCMPELKFDWDSNKDTANIKKHGVRTGSSCSV